MLTMRDAGSKPADVSRSLHRNQNIAIQACMDVGREHRFKVICANAMATVSSKVLSRHYPEYLNKIVFPAVSVLGRLHVGGSVRSVPLWLLLSGGLVFTLAMTAPWLAAWGATIIALHGSLLVLLAALAAPYSGYLITSEPVLIAALTVMLVRALTDTIGAVRGR